MGYALLSLLLLLLNTGFYWLWGSPRAILTI